MGRLEAETLLVEPDIPYIATNGLRSECNTSVLP